MAWDNSVVKRRNNGCNPGLRVANGTGLVVAQKWQVDRVLAWDNSVVKGRDNGCNPGLRVANGKGLVEKGQAKWVEHTRTGRKKGRGRNNWELTGGGGLTVMYPGSIGQVRQVRNVPLFMVES